MKTPNEILNEEQEKQAGLLKNARRIIDEWICERPSIDKLLRDKIDDYIIIRELPLPIVVGQKTIYVGTFTLETQDIFFKEYTQLIAIIAARHAGMELGITLLKDGAQLYTILAKDQWIRKYFYRMIQRTILKKQDYFDPVTKKKHKLPKCSLGYFKKHITIDGLIQILMLIYIYNYDATRRSLVIPMGEMGASQTSQTFMWSWLRNLAGTKGKFLIDQLPK